MISFQRKMALRKQAGGSVAARRKTEALARTGQVARSTVRVGDDDLALDQVLVGAVDEAVAGEARDSDIAFLDESEVDSFDTIIDAGDAADVDSMLDAQDSDPDLIDEFEATAAADEDAHQADMTAIGANLVVSEAQAAAEEASELALEAKITADGRNRIYAQALNPVASPEFPFVSGDLWYRTETVSGVTRFVEVFMWNGTEWKPYQMVASSLLVPGTVGPTLIENGAITTGKLAATAIDGMTVTGAILRTAATGRRFVMNALALEGYDEADVKRVSLYPTTTGLRLDGTTATQYSVLNGSSFGVNNVRAGQYDREAFSANSDRFVVQNVFPDPGADPNKQGFATTEGASGFPSDALMAWLRVAVRAPGLGSAGGEQDARLYADDTMAALDLQAPGGGSARIARVKGGTETVYSGPTFSFESPVKFQGDTSWGALSGSFESSVTSGAVDYRIHHGVIYIRLNLTGTFPVGTTDLFSGMPTALRPYANMFAAAFLTSGNTGTVLARAAGTIAVAHQSGGTRAGVQGTIIYPLL